MEHDYYEDGVDYGREVASNLAKQVNSLGNEEDILAFADGFFDELIATLEQEIGYDG